MFGRGIYFADMVSKSAKYSRPSGSDSTGLMLLCEVALGHMKEFTQAKDVQTLPKGMHSAMGKGRMYPNTKENFITPEGVIVPLGKVIYSGLNCALDYNEYIVYDEAQVNVKYLFKMTYGRKVPEMKM